MCKNSGNTVNSKLLLRNAPETKPDFKSYYKATVIKIGWYYQKDRNNQWKITLSSERALHICGQ